MYCVMDLELKIAFVITVFDLSKQLACSMCEESCEESWEMLLWGSARRLVMRN